MENRLQLRGNYDTFATKNEAIEYVKNKMIFTEGKKALFGEPLVLKYGDQNNPNIILAIGSYGDGTNDDLNNNYFFLDNATIENDIKTIFSKLDANDEIIKKIFEDIDKLIETDVDLYAKILELRNALNEEIDRAKSAELALRVFIEDTDTVLAHKNDSPTGVTLSNNVKLSSISGNQLMVQDSSVGGGMYVNVDLKYSSDTDAGKLDLLVNGKTVKTVNLPLEKFLKTAYYDKGNKELVLVFVTEGKGEETVRLPLGDLVDLYSAGDGLKLADNKFTVIINNLSEKFLTVNTDGISLNGVQNAINTSTENEKLRAETVETDLNNKINSEVNRAKTAEHDIVDLIEIEKNRAITAEAKIVADTDALVTNEKNRAMAAEAKIVTDTNALVANEKNRAITAEAKIVADTDVLVTNEKNRAMAAENNLTNKIKAEENRALSIEDGLQKSLDILNSKTTNLHNNLIIETNRAIDKETEINLNLTEEITRAKGEEVKLDTKIDNNTTKITNEENRAITVENILRTDLTTESNRATNAEIKVEENAKKYTDITTSSMRNGITIEINEAEQRAKDFSSANDLILDNKINIVNNKSITAAPIDSTLTLNATRETNGNVNIKAKTNISATNKIIEIKDDGLCVDLSVEFKNDVLTLKGSNGFISNTNIAIGGLIEKVEYVNKTLFISFKKADGTTETVTIDLSDLVTDWVINNDVYSGGKKVSVDLYKISQEGKLDTLYGNVKMLDLNYTPTDVVENNILGKTNDGRLFVDGVTKTIKHKNNSLENTINSIETVSNTADNNSIVAGDFDQNSKTLHLIKKDSSTVDIPGFDIIIDTLDGVTAHTFDRYVELVDRKGNTVDIDLRPIIATAVRDAVLEIVTPIKFKATNGIKISDETETITGLKYMLIQLADDAVIDCGKF